jgi:isopentenyldiphosphate isomerase
MTMPDDNTTDPDTSATDSTNPHTGQIDNADSAELVAAAAAQLVEHVDADGNVIEIVTRAEMRDRALRHRSVYIAVVDTDNRLLVHRRADWKDVFPGAWDLAFGGVCDVGEGWHESAERELLEEAGVLGTLMDLGPVSFEAPGVALVGRFYLCRHDGPFQFNDGEVTATKWVPIEEVDAFVADHEVPPDSALIVSTAALRRATAATSDDPDT